MKPIYKIAFGVSVVLSVASLVVLFMYGLNFGVDFKGGSVLSLHFNGPRPSVTEINEVIAKDNTIKEGVGVSPTGNQGVIIRSRELSEEEHQSLVKSIKTAFPESGLQEIRFDSVGPVVGGELRARSVKAIIVVLVSISLYIAFVFRKLARTLSPWAMSLATLIALAHDMLLPIGVFALLGHFGGVEVSAVFVAAILTILGYSISDTVVVFDRVRENIIRGNLNKESFASVVQKSIMQTLVRSINTSITTLLALVSIYFFGGESIKYFALALILGIVAGAYSSIFIASPLLVWLSKPKR